MQSNVHDSLCGQLSISNSKFSIKSLIPTTHSYHCRGEKYAFIELKAT